MTEPIVRVGIMTCPEISLDFISPYSGGNRTFSGHNLFRLHGNEIEWNGNSYPELKFTPVHSDGCFELRDVTIGVDFHWQRKENQRFQGAVRLIVVPEAGITVINEIQVEAYLRSVISSEMRATSSLELLKAHAVISRSWLLAQIKSGHRHSESEQDCISSVNADEIVRWYDHTDHSLFDVCADDHCQRYQGITRAGTPDVDSAISLTAGQVLTHNGELCDARFSKCCGGVMELFENCWEPVHHPYLKGRRDAQVTLITPDIDLTDETNARRWIMSSPESFCSTTDTGILSQILNSYDRETPDFYRWRVDYTQAELADIIKSRSGIDFGRIIRLEPLQRGPSGRIIKLRITGSERTVTVGKELEIRRWLSRSHLYSSAFIVEPSEIDSLGTPQKFTLHGAGWGHGVGLCQIGAAVMASRGYSYDRILSHYYPGASIEKLY